MSIEILTPRLNANEDQVLVVDILVNEGDAVEAGKILFVVESTKASSEVAATESGTVDKIKVKKGAMADVGAVMCRLKTGKGKSESKSEDKKAESAAGSEVRISAKARLRAQELGVDISKVPASEGQVSVKDVEAYSTTQTSAVTATVTGQPAYTAPQITGAGHEAVIVGAGGHAVIVADALIGLGWRVIGCTDRSAPIGTPLVGDIQVIGTDDILPDLIKKGVRTAFVGIGGATDNTLRKKIYLKLKEMGFSLPPFVHPSARLGAQSTLGEASYVFPMAGVGALVRIGANTVINQGAQVCHESVIGDHCHITPGAIVAGKVTIGAETTLGMASTVLFGVKIGERCLVHNNASVTGNISDNMELTRTGHHIPRT